MSPELYVGALIKPTRDGVGVTIGDFSVVANVRLRLRLGVEGGRGTLKLAGSAVEVVDFRGGRRLDLLESFSGSSSVVNDRLRSEMGAPLVTALFNGVLAVRAERLSDMTSDSLVQSRTQPIREKTNLAASRSIRNQFPDNLRVSEMI